MKGKAKARDIVQLWKKKLSDFQINPFIKFGLSQKVKALPSYKRIISFLGLNTHVVYPNGLNTAFAPETQLKILRTIKGLENVKMIRPGYL
jgi:hypothetical protein